MNKVSDINEVREFIEYWSAPAMAIDEAIKSAHESIMTANESDKKFYLDVIKEAQKIIESRKAQCIKHLPKDCSAFVKSALLLSDIYLSKTYTDNLRYMVKEFRDICSAVVDSFENNQKS